MTAIRCPAVDVTDAEVGPNVQITADATHETVTVKESVIFPRATIRAANVAT